MIGISEMIDFVDCVMWACYSCLPWRCCWAWKSYCVSFSILLSNHPLSWSLHPNHSLLVSSHPVISTSSNLVFLFAVHMIRLLISHLLESWRTFSWNSNMILLMHRIYCSISHFCHPIAKNRIYRLELNWQRGEILLHIG